MLKLTYIEFNKIMYTINYFMQKIKQFIESNTGKDILIIFIIILVGLGSFMLGRLSIKEEKGSNIGINYNKDQNIKGEVLNANIEENSSINLKINENDYEFKEIDLTGRNYFASSRGKKYYPFGCSAGKSIKQENRIYFNTEEEAKKAGYTLSGSCN